MNRHRNHNYLLRTMSDADFALLEPSLTFHDIVKNEDLALPESRVRYTWFPVAGIASVVAETPSGTQAEVGLIGREGMCSVATVHGIEVEMMHVFVQVPGQALRLPAATLRGHLATSPTLLQHLLRYAQNFMVQITTSALAYATQTIEARLARWLLMSLDRLDGNEVGMTHESLSLMLGVRRAGVTVAVQSLEAKGAVIGRRAALTVTDRAVLQEIAGDSYGGAEQAYERVIGVPLSRSGYSRSDGALAAP